MKKNLTKKLMLSVLTLAFAVVSLGASTFAWFTMSGTADVASFEGKVVSSEGIEIGYSAIGATADQIKWKTEGITSDEITKLIAEINTGDENGKWSFNAVTPKNLTDPYNFTGIQGTEDVKGQYVGFSLYFQLSDNTTGKTYPVNMTQLWLQNSVGAKTWNCDTAIVRDKAGNKTAVGTNYTYDVLAATRLAIIGDGGWSAYYEPSKAQVASGSEHTTGLAGYNDGTKDNVAFGALELYNVRMNKTYTAPESEVATFVELPAHTEKEVEGVKVSSLNSVIPIGEISGDEVLKLNIYLWIEGWDAECLNTLFAQGLSLDLGFELDKEKAA